MSVYVGIDRVAAGSKCGSNPMSNPPDDPADAPDSKLAFEVKLEGGVTRKCTAFRRKEGGSWYLRVSRRGKDVWVSLKVKGSGPDDVALVETRAKFLLEEMARDEFRPKGEPCQSVWPVVPKRETAEPLDDLEEKPSGGQGKIHFEVKLEGGIVREVTVFRRKAGGAFYLRVERRGKRIWKSMKVKGRKPDDLAILKKRAKFVLEEMARDEFRPPKAKAASTEKKKLATLGEVFARYKEAACVLGFRHRVEEHTARDNIAKFRFVVRIARGMHEGYGRMGARSASGKGSDDPEIDSLSSAVITRDLVGRFLTNYMQAVDSKDGAARNQIAVARRMNGAAHALRLAKSIFAKNKMELYSELQLPDLAEFRSAAVLPVEKASHLAIGPETIAAMHAAAEKLKKKDLRQWLIHILLKHLALRPSEAMEARMSWLRPSDWGQWFFAVVVTESHRPKASLGYTPLPSEVAAEIVRARETLAKPDSEILADDSFLVPGSTEQDRRTAIYRTHSEWMRLFVPADDYEGSNYELRRWGVQVIRRKYGKDAASDFARHAARDVTQAHYLERINVWRDRAPNADAGITWADAVGVKPKAAAAQARAPKAGWRALSRDACEGKAFVDQ